MFGIGFGEMVVIGVLILLAVGPEKIPSAMKTVARLYRQLRRAAMEIRASTGIDEWLREEELKELVELKKQKLLAMNRTFGVPVGKPEVIEKESTGEQPMPYGKPVPGKPGLVMPEESMAVDAGGERLRELPPEEPMSEIRSPGVAIAEARRATADPIDAPPHEPNAPVEPAPQSAGGSKGGGV